MIVFQSTPARGGRPPVVLLMMLEAASFNPRPHAAGDRPAPRNVSTTAGFNPRPHAAGDVIEHRYEPEE